MFKYPLSALLSLSLTWSASAQDVTQIALREGAPFPGLQGTVTNFRQVEVGVDRGWLAVVTLSGTGGGPTGAIVGVRSADLQAAPTVLRVPQTIAGFVQSANFMSPVMTAGQVAYITSNTGAAADWAVFLEDQLLMRSGDPIGATSDTWWGFSYVQALLGGELVVKGWADDGQGGAGDEIAVHYPSQTILVRSGDVLGGTTTPLDSFGYRSSPNGQHSLIAASLSTSLVNAIFLDGQLLDLGGASFVTSGSAIPEKIAGGPGLVWGPLGIRDINDQGDYTFTGLYYIGADTYAFLVRNGRPITPALEYWTQPQLGGLDRRGFTAWGTFHGTQSPGLEEIELLGLAPKFDVDFDGVADPEWQYDGSSKLRLEASGAGAEAFVSGDLEDTSSGTTTRALLRFASYQLGTVYCPGVVNSTGESGRLIAQRSDAVAANDLALQCIGLPQNVFGVFITSRTSGFVVGPGNSQGNLCLGGAVGRFTTDVFATGLAGRGYVPVDLSAVPQPTGPEAALPGETWYFQAWYRDTVNGQATSNFTDATALIMQ